MKQLLILLALTLPEATLLAQEEPLSLDRAIEITHSENLRLRAQQRAEEQAEQLRRAAMGLRSVELSLVGNYTLMERDIALPLNKLKAPLEAWAEQLDANLPHGGGGLVQGLLSPLMATNWDHPLQRRNFGFLALEANLPLWMGGRINSANRMARLEVEGEQIQGEALEAELGVELVERYFAVVLGGEVLRLRRTVVGAMLEHLAQAEALVDEGMIPSVELLAIKQRLAEAQHEAERSELELLSLKRALFTTMGRAVEAPLTTPLFSLAKVEPIEHFLAAAEQQNPQLRGAGLRCEISAEGVRMARSSRLPEVVAVGGVNLAQDHLSELLPRWVVGVGLRWSLFSGLRHREEHRAARQLHSEALLLEEYALQEVELLVVSCYNSLREETSALQSLQSAQCYAEEVVRSRSAALREGEATALQVVDAELELAAVRTKRLEAAYRYDVALARLLSAAGMSQSLIEYLHHPSTIHYDNLTISHHETAQ